jgi:hypothetical protein
MIAQAGDHPARLGTRVPHKHILTTQATISTRQLKAMRESGLTPVVPEPIRKDYPKDSGISILTIDQFFRDIKSRYC